ncbi:MAG TPA: DUF3455 domain-containing protein [Burkholderiaceae bacterium]|nr:DUF3455 domain-containing protein [Burkholderiaceae bacterium]
MRDLMATAAAAVTLAACTNLATVEVPAGLRTAPDEKPTYWLAARGVQIYECRQQATNGFGWAFVAPEAELLDASDTVIGRHGAGPYWQSSDGSRVVGAVKARADAPVHGAIPWLLLTTKSSGPTGRFSEVTSIQRVNTAGGVAPTAGCSEGSRGKTIRVPYTADYVLYTAR